ncbi:MULTISPECIES: helix-turn-helix domain-containing protein [Streptomycetaceae]|uniref:Transcriptional regulator, TrmB n=1 Tax=Streptantibioticus cattleyicolor (strain ATCC 35852 / DSM 46488 / JCM 4925 / NBRC 14057 / NRRL 8057) TaxID=1003195 RepID=F8JNW1_STREN|nr:MULTISPECIES: helix-turn-helix transcriptional regulator [Streptomycetaceae]AEW92695.1 transcriptional regulator, TrmB [Streptantibioticus cattleyicolor NRRL 8057 = DSM 46488]MYS57464.1 DNA-binding response regulator [Streptomyces sp. SID5468]CCB73052.1 putative Predicted transcriptional regulator [Streptantibioticus cattleyicolor NRRL 8057 = DSM 46488]
MIPDVSRPAAGGLLDGLGIPEPEQAAYRRMLALSRTTVAGLAADLGVGEERAARLLAALHGHGLVHRHDDPPGDWSAAAPDVAVEALLLRREAELLRTRGRVAELMRAYRRGHEPHAADLVDVVTGQDAIAGLWRRLQEAARHNLLMFDKPPHIVRADTAVERELLDRGVRIRVVYEAGSVNAPGRLAEIRDAVAAGEQARMLPELPCKLALVDDRWALLPATTGAELTGAVLVRASTLLDALGAMFAAYWHRGVRVADTWSPADPAAERRMELLTLLSAGFTDDSIARQLGVSPRTVQRWVREVMDSLGARTRFQAGIQAARAGLL